MLAQSCNLTLSDCLTYKTTQCCNDITESYDCSYNSCNTINYFCNCKTECASMGTCTRTQCTGTCDSYRCDEYTTYCDLVCTQSITSCKTCSAWGCGFLGWYGDCGSNCAKCGTQTKCTNYELRNCRQECTKLTKTGTYCCMTKQVSEPCCTSYISKCDTCTREDCTKVSKTCTQTSNQCTPCTKCTEYKKETINCPDNGNYCNDNTLEFRKYTCSKDCTYQVMNTTTCPNGCSINQCNQELRINTSSITCTINGNNCLSASKAYTNNLITVSYELLNTKTGSINTQIKTSNNQVIKTITSNNKLITASFTLLSGKHTITAVSTQGSESATSTLFTLTINDANTNTNLKPFDYTPGNYEESSNPLTPITGNATSIPAGLTETLIITAGTATLYLLKKKEYGTYVPDEPIKFNEQLINAKRREEIFDEFLSKFSFSVDFIKGFIFGSNDKSNASEIAGDFASGMLLYGDIRDCILYGLNNAGIIKGDYDELFLSFAIFGILTEVVDVGDFFVTAFKQAWKKTPKPVKEAWTIFMKKAGNNINELGQALNKISSKIPLNKLTEFIESTSQLISKTPLNKLDELTELFSKLLKFTNEPGRLLRKCVGLDEAIKLSKYVDNVGDAFFTRAIKELSTDEIINLATKKQTITLIDDTIELKNGYQWISKYGDNIDEAYTAVSKKSSDINHVYTLTHSDSWFNGRCSNDGIIEFNNKFITKDNIYEVAVHELTHNAQSGTNVIVKGFSNPKQAYTTIFNDKLSYLSRDYTIIDDAGNQINLVYNQFHDTVVNKLIITNENVNFNKWYNSWINSKNDLLFNLNNFEHNNMILNDFVKNKIDLPDLVEMQVLFETIDPEKALKINEFMEAVKKVDKSLWADYNNIYDAYSEIFNKVKWK